jgi:hypothetical protein
MDLSTTNDRIRALSQLRGSLAKEYRKLHDLRERVRKAEAAAAIRPRSKSGKGNEFVVSGEF